MPALGDEFRAAREARHLSLSDVSEQIHIRSVYLQSIEDEEWSAIAAPVYVRGFVRTYARFLGLDQEAAVEHFNASVGAAATRPYEQVATQGIDRKRGPSPWLWLAALAAIVLVAFVAVRYFQYQQGGASPTSVAAAGTPAASSPASPIASSAAGDANGPTAAGAGAAAASGSPGPTPSSGASGAPGSPAPTDTLEVSVTAPSWLLVRVDGSQVMETVLQPGARKTFHGSQIFLRAGNAGGIQLKLNGKDLGAMGTSGAVVERRLKLASAVQ